MKTSIVLLSWMIALAVAKSESPELSMRVVMGDRVTDFEVMGSKVTLRSAEQGHEQSSHASLSDTARKALLAQADSVPESKSVPSECARKKATLTVAGKIRSQCLGQDPAMMKLIDQLTSLF